MSKLISILALSLFLFQTLYSPVNLDCDYDPFVSEMLSESKQYRWMGWIRALSGADPIQTENGEEIIQTRSSLVLFEPDFSPSAFDYLVTELEKLGFVKGKDFYIHTYNYPYGERYPQRNWKNIILTFPGQDPRLKEERVLLVAHFDSTSDQECTLAPGADDNASGTAGLLEAAAILRHYQFSRTIHLIWFSGEEKSRVGSNYFVKDYADWLPDIIGVVNLDMFAFDGDNDRCFEIHAGTLPGAHDIGSCLGTVIDQYNLDLTYDFINDDTAYHFSDHYYFWKNNVPAVILLGNSFYQEGKACGKSDRNYNYHTIYDTVAYINEGTGFSIVKAGIGTIAHLAQPLSLCFTAKPEVEVQLNNHYLKFIWLPVKDVEIYQLWAEIDGQSQKIGETSATEWFIPKKGAIQPRSYQIVGISPSGCQTKPALILPTDYLPLDRHFR